MAEVEENHTFSSSLVNTARLGFNRTTGLVNQPVSAINPLATNTSLGGLPGLTAPGVSSVGGVITPFAGGFGGLSEFFHHQNSFQGYDDVFVTHGNHSLQTGFGVERLQYNLLAAGRPTGSFAFGSLADFLTDVPQSVQTLNPATKSMAGLRSTILAAYVQDDWRARSNLTLNLGLRWEGVTAPTCSVGECPLLTNLYAPGPAVESPVLFNPPNYAGFEPRVGFSWDPFHTGKTAIRGGFGVFDILDLPYEYTAKIALAAPFEETGGTSVLPTGAFPSLAFQLAAFNPTTFLAPYIQQNPPPSYAMNWNFNIEHQFGKGVMATVGYLGSRTNHGPFTMDDNNIVTPAALTSAGYLWPSAAGTRINPDVGDIRSLMWNDPASYHSLQAEVRKTFSHGMQFQASYSWSKCIDRGSAVIFGDAFTNSISSLLYFDNSLRQGLCDFNISQSFVGNYLWDVPTPFSKGSIPDHVLGGLELGGIVTLQSGVPFTPVIGGDPLGIGGTDPWAYPGRLSGPGCGSGVNPGNVNSYINLNCFALPQATPAIAAQCVPFGAPAAPIAGTCSNLLGNAGRNELVGPGLATFDFSLFKNIPVKRVSENFNIQFRAEFFNFLNRPNFLPPLDNITLFNQSGGSVGGTGQIDATSTTSREIQFGLKVNW